MSRRHQHVCSAIFGPSGKLEHISPVLDERTAWMRFLGWPPRFDAAVMHAKSGGYRYAAVVVTEGGLAAPAPPPPGTRFDDEGQPEARHG